MKIFVRKTFAVFGSVCFALILAPVASAQWTLIESVNDADGKETKRVERHKNGSVRTMTRLYYPNSRVRKVEEVITRFADGSRTRVEEQRDIKDRITLIYNGVKDAKGEMIRGSQQWFSYENAGDTSGTQKNFVYDRRTKSWKKL